VIPKKYFKVKRKINFINSRFICVNQNRKNHNFWLQYKQELDKILAVYTEKIEPKGCSDRSLLYDEIYYTLALIRMKEKPIRYNAQTYSTVSGAFLHGKDARRSKRYSKMSHVLKQDKYIGTYFD